MAGAKRRLSALEAAQARVDLLTVRLQRARNRLYEVKRAHGAPALKPRVSGRMSIAAPSELRMGVGERGAE